MICVAVAVGVCNVLFMRGPDAGGLQSEAREAALKSAVVRLPAMLSFSYRTLESDFAVAGGNATGPFAAKYASALNEVAAPHATTEKVITRARVSQAAIVKGDAKRAVVLAFLTQSTTSRASKKPKIATSEIRVEMTHTDQGWFVSGLDPL